MNRIEREYCVEPGDPRLGNPMPANVLPAQRLPRSVEIVLDKMLPHIFSGQQEPELVESPSVSDEDHEH